MYLLNEVREKLNELGISPKKSLGQNFLINPDSIQRIVSATQRFLPAEIVEIGPGLGAITDELKKLGHPLKVVELDRSLCDWWRKKGLVVFEADALKADWPEITQNRKTVLVSNLPYQISASLVIDRCIEPAGIEGMILMFQKEVAQRIVAKQGGSDYGLLSVVAQSYWEVDRLLEISSKDFFPPPGVASRVLVFRRLAGPEDREGFLKFIKAAFAQRRKFLIKNLSKSFKPEDLEGAFDDLRIDRKVRAEALTVLQFKDLFQTLKERKR